VNAKDGETKSKKGKKGDDEGGGEKKERKPWMKKDKVGEYFGSVADEKKKSKKEPVPYDKDLDLSLIEKLKLKGAKGQATGVGKKSIKEDIEIVKASQKMTGKWLRKERSDSDFLEFIEPGDWESDGSSKVRPKRTKKQV
jgi:hypothetical protein